MAKEKVTKESKQKTSNQEQKRLQWKPDAVIEISGAEFYQLNMLAQAFAPAVFTASTILQRMVASGIATPEEDITSDIAKATVSEKDASKEISDAPKSKMEVVSKEN